MKSIEQALDEDSALVNSCNKIPKFDMNFLIQQNMENRKIIERLNEMVRILQLPKVTCQICHKSHLIAEIPWCCDIIVDSENVLRTVFVYINENHLKNCLQLLDVFPTFWLLVANFADFAIKAVYLFNRIMHLKSIIHKESLYFVNYWWKFVNFVDFQ